MDKKRRRPFDVSRYDLCTLLFSLSDSWLFSFVMWMTEIQDFPFLAKRREHVRTNTKAEWTNHKTTAVSKTRMHTNVCLRWMLIRRWMYDINILYKCTVRTQIYPISIIIIRIMVWIQFLCRKLVCVTLHFNFFFSVLLGFDRFGEKITDFTISAIILLLCALFV